MFGTFPYLTERPEGLTFEFQLYPTHGSNNSAKCPTCGAETHVFHSEDHETVELICCIHCLRDLRTQGAINMV